MAQIPNSNTLMALIAGAGLLAAAAFSANLLSSPAAVTQLDDRTLRSLTTDGTFKSVQGDGSRAIHVFLSADCKFCLQIEPEFDQLNNVTVYRHLLPGHTKAGRLKAIDVWCSDNQVGAWKKIGEGLVIQPAKCSDVAAIDGNLVLAKRLGLTSTPSIVFEDGHVSSGMVSSSNIAARIALSTPQ